MSINFSDRSAVVEGVATVDDAEALVQWLQLHEGEGIDLHACTHLHASCLQALMVAQARIARYPADPAFAVLLQNALPHTDPALNRILKEAT